MNNNSNSNTNSNQYNIPTININLPNIRLTPIANRFNRSLNITIVERGRPQPSNPDLIRPNPNIITLPQIIPQNISPVTTTSAISSPPVKRCRCGSTTHLRITSNQCPLNKSISPLVQNQAQTSSVRQRLNFNFNRNSRLDIGSMDLKCDFCESVFWKQEKTSSSTLSQPLFKMCCAQGKVKLDLFKSPPAPLNDLLISNSQRAIEFRENIRAYNSIFSFASLGIELDQVICNNPISNLRIHGSCYHAIGSMLPDSGAHPKFAQLYIHDTEFELKNRLKIMPTLDKTTMEDLQKMMHEHNPYAKLFKTAATKIKENPAIDLRLVIRADQSLDRRRYNLPTNSEIAVLLIGETTQELEKRDIVVTKVGGQLKRISPLNPAHDPLHFVLLFPKGEEGYRRNIPYTQVQSKSANNNSAQNNSLQNNSLQNNSLQNNSIQNNSIQNNSIQNNSIQNNSIQINLNDALNESEIEAALDQSLNNNMANNSGLSEDSNATDISCVVETSAVQTSTVETSTAQTASSNKKKCVTMKQFYSYHLMVRKTDLQWLLRAKRLFQEYVVVNFAKIQDERLSYIRHQYHNRIRCEKLNLLEDAVHRDDADPKMIGKRIVLPSTFIGSPRHLYQLYQDAMSIVRKLGKPDLFITFTANPQWPEITRELLEGQIPSDRPDLIARVFHIKLKIFLKFLIRKRFFGKVIGYIHVIEFQKRGLPHAHILLILDPRDKPKTIEDYDRLVSAEIPDPQEDIDLYQTITTCMMHGPCHVIKESPCLDEKGKCTKGFPKSFCEQTRANPNGYPEYKRPNNGRFVSIKGIQLDNRSVVPYNRTLSKIFNAHINVEVCNSITAVKYLYKYVYKGHDLAFAEVIEVNETNQPKVIDEIQNYINARYVSTSEALWRIFGYSLHKESPAIIRLAVHLPGQQFILFNENNDINDTLNKASNTTLTEWFKINEKNPETRHIPYDEFPQHFTWNLTTKTWVKRKRGHEQIVGRMYFVQPKEGERYYLRLLLNNVSGATSFENLRTVDQTIYPTFKEAAIKRGLLEDDRECYVCLEEAAIIKTGKQLRELLATVLVFCEPTRPEKLWEKFKYQLTEDIAYRLNQLNQNQNTVDDFLIFNEALIEIDQLLSVHYKCK